MIKKKKSHKFIYEWSLFFYLKSDGKKNYLLHKSIVRDLESAFQNKRDFLECFFRAPLFLGKWFGVTTYFLYKKIRKNKYMIEWFHSLIE